MTGGDDGRYVFWNFDGKTLTPEGHNITGGVYGYAAFSPDGTKLAAGGMDVHLFGVGTWTDLGSLTIDYTSYGVAFSPDGQRVVDADSDNLYVHSVSALSQLGKTALDHIPWAMSASPAEVSGALGVATVSTSGYATIYNIVSPATFGTPIIIQPSVNKLWAAAFSPTGTQLALGGYDSFVNIWSYPLASASAQPVISFSIDEPAHLEDVERDRVLAQREVRCRRRRLQLRQRDYLGPHDDGPGRPICDSGPLRDFGRILAGGERDRHRRARLREVPRLHRVV